MKDQNIYGVILAGGSGSRLWPLSRQKYPKQLLKLAGEYSLFQSTFLRLADFIKDENIITVTNTDQTTDLQIQLDNLKSIFNQQNEYRVLSEPLGRNTAPAIALAVFYVLKHMVENNDDPILLVSPSDHLVKNQKEFTRVIQEGTKLADNGYIVTFGITPNKPETGYGYIKTEKTDAISNIALEGLKVSEFKEKPNFETAKQYLEAGTYYWNGGIFMFKASTMLNELQKYAKDIFDGLKDTKINAFGETISKDDYEQLPNISGGIGHEYHDIDENIQVADRFLEILNSNDISWVYWCLSNKDEEFSMLKKDSTKYSGFTGEDFTRTGEYIVNQLND